MADKSGASAVERTRQTIEQAIRAGEFVAGQRLIESELTERLGVSRGTLREALHRLEADALVTIHPNRGAMVRQLSRRDLAEFFQLRGLLEGFAAARCAKRIDEDGVRETISAFFHEAQTYGLGKASRPFAEHDAEMHDAMLRLAGNHMLEEYWRRLRMPIFLFRSHFFNNTKVLDVDRSAAEHVEILGAVLDGDEARAESVTRAHVARINGIVQRMVDPEFDRVFHFQRAADEAASAVPSATRK